jgi:hypothetical protein
LVEDGVAEAYKLSLLKAGYSENEAEEQKDFWDQNIPAMDVIVDSDNRKIEVFTDALSFNAVAINDNERYPSGALVMISGDPEKGQRGGRLVDVTLDAHKANKSMTFYWWGIRADGMRGVLNSNDNSMPQGMRQRYLGK